MMNIKVISFLVLTILVICNGCSSSNTKTDLPSGSSGYIGVSRELHSYFQFSDGSPYIPVGINMINPSGKYHDYPDSSLYEIGQWMEKLSGYGGNYVRIWLSQSFWDVEDTKAGVYSEEKAKRIDRFIEMARKNNLRIKMTLEHFRSITLEENPQPWALKSVYHTSKGGPLDSIREYLSSEAGYKLFLDKADYYRNRYGSDTLFFGWELWNEMNAMKGPEDTIFFNWNVKMLEEVKKRFPENLVMQSLGSFDHDGVRPVYKKMMLLEGNQVAEVHRYLDLGARMEVCHMPMDIICSSAVEEILSYDPGKPVILAETGAVEPRHSGPSKYYPLDTAGILLHDILFAPFFSGAAGAGMSWHWESYVDRNDLWYHFGRFTQAVRDIDPIAERFVPIKSENDQCRMYLLSGRKSIIMWLRDKNSNWITELEEGRSPDYVSSMEIDISNLGITDKGFIASAYDPWKDKWLDIKTEGTILSLPDFKRSLVIRIEKTIQIR
ncbi:MAG: hypothetical protein GYA41_12765 [Bacteroidales bacterium]|nr:hypothetical protein [Bacteroidales bacterium]